MNWPKEEIPDEDHLYMRVHRNHLTPKGSPIPGAFRDHRCYRRENGRGQNQTQAHICMACNVNPSLINILRLCFTGSYRNFSVCRPPSSFRLTPCAEGGSEKLSETCLHYNAWQIKPDDPVT